MEAADALVLCLLARGWHTSIQQNWRLASTSSGHQKTEILRHQHIYIPKCRCSVLFFPCGVQTEQMIQDLRFGHLECGIKPIHLPALDYRVSRELVHTWIYTMGVYLHTCYNIYIYIYCSSMACGLGEFSVETPPTRGLDRLVGYHTSMTYASTCTVACTVIGFMQ